MPTARKTKPTGKPEDNGVSRVISRNGRHLTAFKVVCQLIVAEWDDSEEIVNEFPGAQFALYGPDLDKLGERVREEIMPQVERAWTQGGYD